ncbi:penicillin-binding transpeptidase domain-containing protein [Lederbergia sp. NSJ-179]|uniref:penicillin-binding protein PBP4(5) n=1 Tax=Lederbergia sp. NSJ-179 TaxID=2931402 RepID=UPI001FD080F7|nr:penicillin-binding transpeptidase domain-containing protein [Lederbergia sp. NSJ-179]MCJ7841447.1 penicillin-binding transpeptidase domain-containing protein [Lederbergia sp. NSJ-179]
MNRQMKRQKRRFIPYVVIGFIILIGAGGFGLFQFINGDDRHQVEEVAHNFLQILEKKEYEKLHGVLDKQSYTSLGYTFDEVVDKYDHIFNGIPIDNIHASKITVEKINHDEQMLSFQLSLTTPLGKLENVNYQTKVIKKDDDYFVEWDPSLIFPGMEGKDKIAFRTSPAERGEIHDHLGNGLASNEDFKQVGIVPKELAQGKKKENRLQKISEQFNIPIDELNEKLQQSWVKEDLFVPLKVIEPDQVKELPGVAYQNVTLRYYPLKEAAANLVGYIGKVTKEDLEKNPNLPQEGMIGKMGLERAYDKELRGKDGGELIIVDEKGEQKQEIQKVEKVDGENIQLTIDAYIQKEAFEHLKGKAGSTVVMNPKDGGLYALVSSPSFDPNKMVQGVSQEEYNQYANDEDKPFISRFAVGYAPGSTFKTITAGIGLDANVTRPDKVREINGLNWQKDESWGGYSVTRVSDVKKVDMRQAFIYSDNIYFAQEALEMGEKTFRNGLKPFIFGEELDLPIAMNPAQISNQASFDSDILLADTAYGQGELLMTPIQQAVMYSVFQNDGDIVYPRLLKDQKERKTKSAFTSSTANEIEESLVNVVRDPNGTAHSLYNPQHHLAAKTGTAELKMKQGEQGSENSFLLAFDTDNDDFLVVSLVENYTPGNSATQLNQTFMEQLYSYFQNLGR